MVAGQCSKRSTPCGHHDPNPNVRPNPRNDTAMTFAVPSRKGQEKGWPQGCRAKARVAATITGIPARVMPNNRFSEILIQDSNARQKIVAICPWKNTTSHPRENPRPGNVSVEILKLERKRAVNPMR